MKKMLKIVYYFLKQNTIVLVNKRRARRLGIKYSKGLILGKHIQVWGSTKVIVGEDVRIASNCVLWGNGIINIGSRTHIGENSWIYANISGGVTLGNDVNCAANLYIIDTDHVYQGAGTINSHGYISKFIEIGNNVWIGANVTILKGTIIRDRTVIGACSLCNKEYNGNKIIAEFQQKKLKIFKTTLLYISLIYN